ncbi:hypothetical protein GCM10020331_099280 [Ectobacillus funiculus]
MRLKSQFLMPWHSHFLAAPTTGLVYKNVLAVENTTATSVNQTATNVSPIEESLTTWYKFDQLNGTSITDASGHGKDAAAMNGASLATVNGRTGIDLEHTKSQYVQLPTGIMSTLSDFTISTWVYLDSKKTGNWARIFDFWNRS